MCDQKCNRKCTNSSLSYPTQPNFEPKKKETRIHFNFQSGKMQKQDMISFHEMCGERANTLITIDRKWH